MKTISIKELYKLVNFAFNDINIFGSEIKDKPIKLFDLACISRDLEDSINKDIKEEYATLHYNKVTIYTHYKVMTPFTLLSSIDKKIIKNNKLALDFSKTHILIKKLEDYKKLLSVKALKEFEVWLSEQNFYKVSLEYDEMTNLTEKQEEAFNKGFDEQTDQEAEEYFNWNTKIRNEINSYFNFKFFEIDPKKWRLCNFEEIYYYEEDLKLYEYSDSCPSYLWDKQNKEIFNLLEKLEDVENYCLYSYLLVNIKDKEKHILITNNNKTIIDLKKYCL